MRDEAMPHAQVMLAYDGQRVLEQQVIVAVNAPSERVFNRHEAAITRPGLHGGKDLVKGLARDSDCLAPKCSSAAASEYAPGSP